MAVKDLVEERCSQAQQKIVDSLSTIVDKVIEKAKADGSVPHAKFLLDWAELKPGAQKEASAKKEEPVAAEKSKETEEPDLAEVLLTTLREMLEEEKQAKAEEAKQAAAGISVP